MRSSSVGNEDAGDLWPVDELTPAPPEVGPSSSFWDEVLRRDQLGRTLLCEHTGRKLWALTDKQALLLFSELRTSVALGLLKQVHADLFRFVLLTGLMPERALAFRRDQLQKDKQGSPFIVVERGYHRIETRVTTAIDSILRRYTHEGPIFRAAMPLRIPAKRRALARRQIDKLRADYQDPKMSLRSAAQILHERTAKPMAFPKRAWTLLGERVGIRGLEPGDLSEWRLHFAIGELPLSPEAEHMLFNPIDDMIAQESRRLAR